MARRDRVYWFVTPMRHRSGVAMEQLDSQLARKTGVGGRERMQGSEGE